MKYLRWLLLPLSLLYGLAIIIRNWCYDSGAFKSYKFNKPVIAVGNLDVGGAGKSPMTEYLVRLLKNDYKLATLSRGYGRTTKGFIDSNDAIGSAAIRDGRSTLAAIIGDEPAQFKQKFPGITVAVCEKRVDGIRHLITAHDVILLDDAYQHRSVEPGLNILLFDYRRINEPHFILPAGNLREPFSGRWRANVMVVSKCPADLSEDEKNRIAQKIRPLPYQSLFFSSIAYQAITYKNGEPAAVTIDAESTVFLLTGIANPAPLVRHLEGLTRHIVHHKYPDHHPFTLKNIAKLAGDFSACGDGKKIIVTTEKDAQRLQGAVLADITHLPLFVLPVNVEFLADSGAAFDKIITDYVRAY